MYIPIYIKGSKFLQTAVYIYIYIIIVSSNFLETNPSIPVVFFGSSGIEKIINSHCESLSTSSCRQFDRQIHPALFLCYTDPDVALDETGGSHICSLITSLLGILFRPKHVTRSTS